MANISIVDTGFLKTNNSGTQLSASNKSNSGNLIELKAVDFKPTAKANLDTAPTIGSFTESEIHLVSVENLGFTITGKLDTNTSSDMDLVYQLIRLVRTRGYKALFYNVDRTAVDSGSSTTGKRDQQLVTLLANGHYDTTEPQGTISFSLWTGSTSASGKNLTNVVHMMVRFNNITFIQLPSSMISFTLTGVATA